VLIGCLGFPLTELVTTTCFLFAQNTTPIAIHNMSHFRTIILVVLPLLSIVGAYGTWVLGFRNGLFVDITSLLKQNNALFPGSTAPLLRQYTGITPIDHQLQILVTFFSPVVDGKNPELMLFSILGAGQFGGAWALLMMESLRLGNRGKIISL